MSKFDRKKNLEDWLPDDVCRSNLSSGILAKRYRVALKNQLDMFEDFQKDYGNCRISLKDVVEETFQREVV